MRRVMGNLKEDFTEWEKLIREAKQMGLTVNEVKEFLAKVKSRTYVYK